MSAPDECRYDLFQDKFHRTVKPMPAQDECRFDLFQDKFHRTVTPMSAQDECRYDLLQGTRAPSPKKHAHLRLAPEQVSLRFFLRADTFSVDTFFDP